MTLRTLVIDDEAPARRRIRRLLNAETDVVVVGECGDGTSALRLIGSERPDLVLLDVQIPERDGFEVVTAIPESELPAVLFVTAYDRYALRAFDVHAVDYLLKPFSAERFRKAIDRARERILGKSVDAGMASLAASLRQATPYLTRLPIPCAGRTLFLDLAVVDWIEAADNYVRLHVTRREYLVRDTLAALEARIDPNRFVRVHRSAIVQVSRIAEIRAQSHGDAVVVLDGGETVGVSRTWRERLEAAVYQRNLRRNKLVITNP